MRQIVLDTETTGLEPEQGHRIIDICGIEIINRRPTGHVFQRYLNPEREVDAEALAVHGLSADMLADKPKFSDIVEEFMAFIDGAELIIHNAPFDVGFIDHELKLDGGRFGPTSRHCTIIDSLAMARRMYPAQRNSLDALCKRLGVDNSSRELHGALLDAQLLVDVYLLMTGGQTRLSLSGTDGSGASEGARRSGIRRLNSQRASLPVIAANAQELAEHEAMLERLAEASGKPVAWDA
ncbi:MAG TPA: DNA polymerase III subunit epsilon [Pseudomonadales bacterium]